MLLVIHNALAKHILLNMLFGLMKSSLLMVEELLEFNKQVLDRIQKFDL